MEYPAIFLLIVCGVAWYFYNSSKLNPETTRVNADASRMLKAYKTREDAINDDHILCGDGEFDQEIVGESHYQEQIKLIATSLPAGCNIVQATVEIEDNNPHDKHAVAVKIAGLTVGYLPREIASTYRRLAKIEKIPEKATVPAMIIGGDGKNYGIWLGIAEID